MRITYLSTDELNRKLASQMSQACGVELDISPPRDGRASDPPAATLYDLDHLGGENRRTILEDILSGRSPTLVAVHSYNLQDDEVAALQARGVVVSRRIQPEVVHQLCRIADTRPKLNSDRDGRAPASDGDDASAIGAQVRSLASLAYRVLPRPGGRSTAISPDAIAQVLKQLDQLQSRIGRLQRVQNLRLEELLRWASTLRRLLEEQR